MTNEEKYRRALYLIDALCLAADFRDDSPEGILASTIYRLAHTAHGLCKKCACGNHEEIVKECEAALVRGRICTPWEFEKKLIGLPEWLQTPSAT